MNPVTLEIILRYAMLAQQAFAAFRAAIAAFRLSNPNDNAALVAVFRQLNPSTTLTDEQIVELFDTKFDATMADLFYKNAVAGEADWQALIDRLNAQR